MRNREIDAGPLVAAAGALLLLVSLFLDWFEGGGEFNAFSAWTAFEVWDVVLAALALAALVPAAALVGVPRWLSERGFAAVGAAAFAIVVSQLINHPPAGIDRGLELGAWLGFAGSLAMLAGSASSVARISLAVSVSDRPEEREPPTPPSQEATPAPPPDEPAAAAEPPEPEERRAGPEEETRPLGEERRD